MSYFPFSLLILLLTSLFANSVLSTPVQLRLNGEPRFFKIATFSDERQIELIADNSEVLILKQGRVVKSAQFADNILSIESKELDPVALGLLKPNTAKTWQRKIHFSSQHAAVEVSSMFRYLGEKSILVKNQAIDTHLFIEKLAIPALELHSINKFWISKDGEKVVKSEQLIAPKAGQLTITM